MGGGVGEGFVYCISMILLCNYLSTGGKTPGARPNYLLIYLARAFKIEEQSRSMVHASPPFS